MFQLPGKIYYDFSRHRASVIFSKKVIGVFDHPLLQHKVPLPFFGLGSLPRSLEEGSGFKAQTPPLSSQSPRCFSLQSLAIRAVGQWLATKNAESIMTIEKLRVKTRTWLKKTCVCWGFYFHMAAESIEKQKSHEIPTSYKMPCPHLGFFHKPYNNYTYIYCETKCLTPVMFLRPTPSPWNLVDWLIDSWWDPPTKNMKTYIF